MESIRNLFALLFGWWEGPPLSFRDHFKKAKEARRKTSKAIMQSCLRLAERGIEAPSTMDIYTDLKCSGECIPFIRVNILLRSLVRNGLLQNLGEKNDLYVLTPNGTSCSDVLKR